MASEHPLLARLEEHVSRYRDTIARLNPELAHLREKEEIVMQYLSDFGTALKTLIGDRQASDARATAAEAENATLKAQIAADEATLKGMLDAANAEISAEQPASSSSSAPVVTTPAPGVTVTVVPAAATTPATDATTGVTTDPGTTTHVDASTGVTTTVPHDGSDPTAATAGGTPVTPDPSAVAAATSATAAAGVTVAPAAA